MSRLHTELVCLFGIETVQAAKKLPVDAIEQEVEQVAEYATRLYQAIGRPEQQRGIVQGMAKGTATALCKWVSDPGIYAEVIGKQVSRQAK